MQAPPKRPTVEAAARIAALQSVIEMLADRLSASQRQCAELRAAVERLEAGKAVPA